MLFWDGLRLKTHNCHEESQYRSLREVMEGLDMISKSTNAHKHMKSYYSHRMPSTCLSHACGSLQGGALQRIGDVTILETF